MNEPLVFKKNDIVRVPFPFADSPFTKKRPALILSTSDFNFKSSIYVFAMITSAKQSSFPLDLEIKNLKSTGLSSKSFIRLKIFSIDSRLIIDKLGHLTGLDITNLNKNLQKLLEI